MLRLVPSTVELHHREPSIVIEKCGFMEDLVVRIDGLGLPIKIWVLQSSEINVFQSYNAFMEELSP
jgi:hypothetical protein